MKRIEATQNGVDISINFPFTAQDEILTMLKNSGWSIVTIEYPSDGPG